ncbi:MAG: hypothetical protein COU32_03230 [Candidatus Magasanikbacteria bacterium CG10_big_fil_rev_8_21_14_0_10_42_10]|uniref:Uncharacterized protein n=2 Tax=Candidatus Magasanikiibacteriota TaxID=1752731 RepID=A0A2H0TXZ2_9BACT|nr:MAG: hypothetical protein COU32_03230 [Candidatus Magasanikbacteria bacterium CG10_big_fil_rev_8_21_14_0_10_42_10]
MLVSTREAHQNKVIFMANKKKTTTQPEPKQNPPTKNTQMNTREAEKQRKAYSQAVYTNRFTHFRILRLSSWIVGISVVSLLGFGLWRLYATVFDTIAATENLFFIQETKRTDVIDFGTLETVRDAWSKKNTDIPTSTPFPLFGIAPTTSSTLLTQTP